LKRTLQRSTRLNLQLLIEAGQTIKIDSEGTSVFPAVEAIDVRDTGSEAEVIFATRVEGQLVPVTIKLDYGKANDLAIRLEPFRKS
jgi:hypothetical protein